MGSIASMIQKGVEDYNFSVCAYYLGSFAVSAIPGKWRDDYWVPGTNRGEIVYDNIWGHGDRVVVQVRVEAPLVTGQSVYYPATSEVIYYPDRTNTALNVKATFAVTMRRQGNTVTAVLDRAYSDDEKVASDGTTIKIPKRVKVEGVDVSTNRLAVLQLMEALSHFHTLPKASHFEASDITNFSTNLSLLEKELRWRKAHVGYPAATALPAEVLVENYRKTLMDRFVLGVIDEAGVKPDLDNITVSFGRYVRLGDALKAQDPSETFRALNNREEFNRVKARLKRTDPDLAAQLTEDSLLFAHYTVAYPPLPGPTVPPTPPTSPVLQ